MVVLEQVKQNHPTVLFSTFPWLLSHIYLPTYDVAMVRTWSSLTLNCILFQPSCRERVFKRELQIPAEVVYRIVCVCMSLCVSSNGMKDGHSEAYYFCNHPTFSESPIKHMAGKSGWFIHNKDECITHTEPRLWNLWVVLSRSTKSKGFLHTSSDRWINNDSALWLWPRGQGVHWRRPGAHAHGWGGNLLR